MTVFTETFWKIFCVNKKLKLSIFSPTTNKFCSKTLHQTDMIKLAKFCSVLSEGLQINFTFSIISWSVKMKRLFSSLNRIKTWFKWTMTDHILLGLFMWRVYREKINYNLKHTEICTSFSLPIFMYTAVSISLNIHNFVLFCMNP